MSDNECLKYSAYTHGRFLDFSNHFATFFEI